MPRHFEKAAHTASHSARDSIVDVDSVIGMGKFRAAHPTLKNKRPPCRNAKWPAARGPADHIGQNLDIMS